MGNFLLWHIQKEVFEQHAPNEEKQTMSKDMLGPLPRALVGVSDEHLPLILDIANRLNSDTAYCVGWHRYLSQKLREGLPKARSIELPPLLVFDSEQVASVDLNERHDPDEFWRDTAIKPVRCVWQGFKTNVVEKAKPRDPYPSGIIKIPYADLSRTAKVCDILMVQGVGNYNPTVLSAIIAAMITKQSNGEPLKNGLLTNGHTNLFPCGSVLVNVYWGVVRRTWFVGSWNPDDEFNSGRRVFSGNLIS